uniref:dihydrofolate reductase n=1 Tax=Mesocestoides corti TaxID=53468 RepID=A0A5K3F6Z2_MESCO
MTLKRLNVIAAVASNGGIGKANKLPWKISILFAEPSCNKKRIWTFSPELQRLLKKVCHLWYVINLVPLGRRNAVILGRNTWASIPPKFRPLPNRINVIVSTQLESSFDDSIRLVESLHDDGLVDEVFVIGGSRIYEAALEQKAYPVRIYCTHIMRDFDCDVFFPSLDWQQLRSVKLDTVDSCVKHCGDIEFRFAVYDL